MFRKIEIKKIRLPLRKPLTTDGSLERQVIRVTASYRNLKIHGECAPLPGLHSESLQQCFYQLTAIFKELKAKRINALAAQTTRPLYPSVRFCLEFILWQLQEDKSSNRRQNKFNNCLSLHPVSAAVINPNKKIKVNKLIGANPQTWEDQINGYLNAGYTTLKIKIGKTALQDELYYLRSIAQRIIINDKNLDTKLKFRLDNNQKHVSVWQSLKIPKSLAALIDYFEEPLNGLDPNYKNWSRKIPGFGLDESLYPLIKSRQNWPLLFQKLDRISIYHRPVIILKPMRLGFITARDFCIQARHKGFRVVISSCFESEHGLSALQELAKLFPDETHGLGTLDWYA